MCYVAFSDNNNGIMAMGTGVANAEKYSSELVMFGI